MGRSRIPIFRWQRARCAWRPGPFRKSPSAMQALLRKSRPFCLPLSPLQEQLLVSHHVVTAHPESHPGQMPESRRPPRKGLWARGLPTRTRKQSRTLQPTIWGCLSIRLDVDIDRPRMKGDKKRSGTHRSNNHSGGKRNSREHRPVGLSRLCCRIRPIFTTGCRSRPQSCRRILDRTQIAAAADCASSKPWCQIHPRRQTNRQICHPFRSVISSDHRHPGAAHSRPHYQRKALGSCA
ncbi:hypothetical protein QBC47DRAFT_435551 [Echria macrotheca]|uniref:Uncharacterized protein n=1 Tax=Echria macrotheca TaxID=438768 RepID=A0AAJ0F526_9PEZI|nr:hypothetical protein QBC47DRAFT_435551 [Echria macrotheca]